MKKAREGYKMTELGEIPEEWSIVTLNDLIKRIDAGVSVNSEDRVAEGNEYGILKTSAVSSNKFLPKENKAILESELDRAKLNPVSGGILVSRMNTIEFVGACAYIDKNYNHLFIPDRLWQLVVRDGVCSRWLYYELISPKIKSLIANIATGTSGSMKNISKDAFKSITLHLPKTLEQQKISSILFSVDEQIEITDNLIEKMKELKKGLMQRLLTKGIGHSRFKDTEIGRIPEEWEVRKLGEVFKVSSGNFLSQKNIVLGDYPVYGGNGIAGYHNEYLFEDSKIVIGRVGAKCGCVHISEPKSWITDNALIISDKIIEFEDDFMFYLLNYINLNQYANQNAQPVISGQKIYELKIALPPLQEQQKIASILSSVDDQISQYESKKEKLQELKRGLMQKLLTGKIRVKVS